MSAATISDSEYTAEKLLKQKEQLVALLIEALRLLDVVEIRMPLAKSELSSMHKFEFGPQGDELIGGIRRPRTAGES